MLKTTMKIKKVYLCKNCGKKFPKWQGKCTQCNAWHTLTEETVMVSPLAKEKITAAPLKPLVLNHKKSFQKLPRYLSGIAEFDRVLGEGIVAGGVFLLGGNPGMGKSTLILQAANNLSKKEGVLYISGEEAAEQIQARLSRLRQPSDALPFVASDNVEEILATLQKEKPQVAIIDSIQTIASSSLPGIPGSITQVKECASQLIKLAKQEKISLIIIGHVTKGGDVAGPKTLEHLVDAVLYLEGDPVSSLRILRSSKNRFGKTSEIGVFEMTQEGLKEIRDPAGIFLSAHQTWVPGSCLTAVLEGSRIILIEVQALTNFTKFGYPKRTSRGYDFNRLQMLLAVLTKRLKLKLERQDVYVNVIGGLTIDEPGTDLAVALAIISAHHNRALPENLVALGEIGLSGEIRVIPQIEKRIQEAKRLGLQNFIIPKDKKIPPSADIILASHINEALNKLF